MMDLFPENEEDEFPEDRKLEPILKFDEEPVPLEEFREATDITSIEALRELAELNPNLLLPYVLPLNEKFTGRQESVDQIFNKEGVQLMHIQMPSILPSINRELETGENDQNDEQMSQKVYQASKLECLPSGKLGKLRVHKSGKIKLHMDGHEFNFSRGSGSTCKQQVCCHLEQNNEFLFLGNFHNRFVVSPDLSDLKPNHHT